MLLHYGWRCVGNRQRIIEKLSKYLSQRKFKQIKQIGVAHEMGQLFKRDRA